MNDHEQDAVVVEVRRELIRMATGVLVERYGVPPATAESALMDWSRISGLGVHDLAARVLADVHRVSPRDE